jgi:hypothetical protein
LLAAVFEFALAFEFEVFEVFEVFDVFDVFIFEGVGVRVFMFVVFAGRFTFVFVLVLAVSPQAIPNAPNASTDESVITFFINEVFLLSSSKRIFSKFRLSKQPCSAQVNFGTNVNIVSILSVVNPETGKSDDFKRIIIVFSPLISQ